MNRFLLFWLLGAATFQGSCAFGQGIYVSKFSPGFPGNIEDIAHRIEIFNESGQTQDLSRYTLVTRNYVVTFPPGSIVRPYRAFRLGYRSYHNDLSLELSQLTSWDRRTVRDPRAGDYVALYNRAGTLVDAFYFGPSQRVDFLPDGLSWTNMSIQLPDENDSRWKYLNNEVDPAVCFVRIGGEWLPNSRTQNLLPATRFRAVQAHYEQGIVTLAWRTLWEQDCYTLDIERSTDGNRFTTIQTISAEGYPTESASYEEYDTSFEDERVYYYRITHTDKFGNTIYSPMAKVRTSPNPDGFAFEILLKEDHQNAELRVRLSSQETQKVRVKLMDAELRQLALLYYGSVEGGKQNLISYTKPLDIGRYFIIISTDEERIYEEFVVD